MVWMTHPEEIALDMRMIRLRRRRRRFVEDGNWKENHEDRWAAYALFFRDGLWQVFPVRATVGGGDSADAVRVVMSDRRIEQVPKDCVFYHFVQAVNEAQQRNIAEYRRMRGLTL